MNLVLLITGCLVNDALYQERLGALSDQDQDGYTVEAGDCDDTDALVHPDAIEICDGRDDDCDGDIDEDGVAANGPWYTDADGDGYGDADSEVTGCALPEGAVNDASDCDDEDADIHPNADEYCDGVDNDCDGDTDEDPVDGRTVYVDADGDGFGEPGTETTGCADTDDFSYNAEDCDDSDASAFPGNEETIDGIDNDCDGAVDDMVAERDGTLIENAEEGQLTGTALLFADVDEDGTDELIVGAPGNHLNSDQTCAVYILDGDLEAQSDFDEATVLTSGTDTECGTALAYDPVAKMLFTSAPWDEGGKVTGWSVPMLEAGPEWTLAYQAQLGSSLSAGGDMDGDGVYEEALGSVGLNSGDLHVGAVLIIPATSLSGVASDVASGMILGPAENAEIGGSVSINTDLNGDGYDDLAIGASNYDEGGHAWLCLGGITLPESTSECELDFIGSENSDAGYKVAIGEDWDNDGSPEWWVSAPGYDDGAGAVFALDADSAGTITPAGAHLLIQGAADSGFGSAIADAGPVEGVLIGAAPAGAASWFQAPRGLTDDTHWDATVQSLADYSTFGSALASSEDLDLWAVGEPGYNAHSPGSVWLFNPTR